MKLLALLGALLVSAALVQANACDDFGQAVEVLAMLRDPARTQVMLVTLAEETPINELIETAYRLEDQLRVALGPIIVNGVLPALADMDRDPIDLIDAASVPKSQLSTLRAAGRWWSTRYARQREELERLAPKYRKDWNYGNAVQDFNLVLGRLAL